MSRGRHTHVNGLEFNSDPQTWVCRPLFVGLHDRLCRFFEQEKEKITPLGILLAIPRVLSDFNEICI